MTQLMMTKPQIDENLNTSPDPRDLLQSLTDFLSSDISNSSRVADLLSDTEAYLNVCTFNEEDELRLLYIKASCRAKVIVSDRILTDAVKSRGVASDLAMKLLVRRNIGCVRKHASGGNGLDYDDAQSRGIEGLWTAAMKYDSDRGVSFISYARSWVYRNTRNRGNKADKILPSLGERPVIDKHHSSEFGDMLMIKNDISYALEKLDDKIRDVIRERFFMNKTIEEITKDLDICKETVIKRIRVGCAQLKNHLKGYEYDICHQ